MTTIHEIGALLRNFRKRSGLTLSALAERSHIHRNTLSALEHGVGNVELNTLLAVCEQLGLDLVPTPGRIATLLRDVEAGGRYRTPDSSALPQRIAARIESGTADEPQRPWSMRTQNAPIDSFDEPTALQKRIAARLASTRQARIEDKK